MLYEKLERTHLFLFDSIDEQVEQTTKVLGRYPGYSIHETLKRHNRDWFGPGVSFSKWKDVVRAVESRWEWGMSQYDRMIKALRECDIPRPKSIKRQRFWSEDTGDEVSIDRLSRGQPYWQATRRDARPGPISVTVIAQTGGLAHREANSLLWRGAACLAMTDLLEQAGYRVELWIGSFVRDAFTCGDDFAFGTCLKRGQDAINPTTMINGVSGWFHRTVKFASHNLVETSVPSLSCGITVNLTPEIVGRITQDQQVMICQDIYSAYQAEEWAKEQMSKVLQPQAQGTW